MKVLRIIEPGPFTTVQDRGRFGFRQFGIPPCGIMDHWAGILANLLVGTPPDAAVLEWTFMGGRLEALDEFDLAVTGGNMALRINGVPRKSWESHRVHRGEIIELGKVENGCRTYLAITGGIDVPILMGSRSTHIAARMGGYEGRILARNDELSRGQGSPLKQSRAIPKEYIPDYGSEILLRVVSGPQSDYFGKGKKAFLREVFTVTSQSNRMGCRLQGPSIHRRRGRPQSIISESVLPGVIQVPEDGQAIVLFSEQTVGGYAKIATVISADIPVLAQSIPDTRIRFEEISLKEAHSIYRKQADRLRSLMETNFFDTGGSL